MGSLIAGIALIAGALTAMRHDIRRFGCAVSLMAGIVFAVRGIFFIWIVLVSTEHPTDADSMLSSMTALLADMVIVAYALMAILGIFLIANSIAFSIRCGLSRARTTSLVFGTICLIPLSWLTFATLSIPGGPSLASILQINPMLRFLIDMTLYLPFVFAAYALYSVLYARMRAHGSYGCLIVLGAGLRGEHPSLLLACRLEAALRVSLSQTPPPLVVVSGGQGRDETISEASAMQAYLIEHGMPESTILQEDRSTSTRQNLQYSKKLIDSRLPHCSGIIVTNDFHALRAAILARACGLAFQSVGCATKRSYRPAAAMREAAIFAVDYPSFAILYATIAALAIALQVLAPDIAALM